MSWDFDSITVGNGRLVTAVGSHPLTLLSMGNVYMSGVINLSGTAGSAGATGLVGSGGGGGGAGRQRRSGHLHQRLAIDRHGHHPRHESPRRRGRRSPELSP